ncbi:unnamed protein product [Adineta ricciae]|uniref:Uncharacterized protein n=1 Tax=Adineta ricciae TaxID=249248 RepID=A0A815FU68_ADIRI|nr:unnamed protein product [Adineta ricciae]
MSGNIGSSQKIYVWLDGNQGESLECTVIRREVEKNNGQFKLCDNPSNCEVYLRSLSPSDHVVFIVSGALGSELVPKIHDLPQIFDIYVYCGNKDFHSQWTKTFPKVKGVFSEFSDLHKNCRYVKVLPTLIDSSNNTTTTNE